MFLFLALLFRFVIILYKNRINNYIDIHGPRWSWVRCHACRFYNIAFIEAALWGLFLVEVGVLKFDL